MNHHEERDPDEFEDEDSSPTEESDLASSDRRVWIVTTAALPWMTGTAMNPLMRALCLTQNRTKGLVTLVIPWLFKRKDRFKLYGEQLCFRDGDDGMKEQEAYIRAYARERCEAPNEEAKLNIMFYSSSYNSGFGSIFPTVDICSLIPENEADVAILEEPEHLNWFRFPPTPSHGNNSNGELAELQYNDTNVSNELGWTHKFRHVVGIIHTNYAAYAQQNGFGTALIGAPTLTIASALVVRAYCHKVIKLSSVLPHFAPGKETTENVHGVRAEFLAKSNSESDVGDKIRAETAFADVYFIGKILWAKGFDFMLEIQDEYRRTTGSYFPIDIFGSGPDEKVIQRAFHGRTAQNEKLPCQKTVQTTEASSCNEDKDEVIEVLKRSAPNIRTLAASGLINKESVKKDANEFLSVLYDASEKSIGTGVLTSQAVYHIADSAIQTGLNMTFTYASKNNQNNGNNDSHQSMFFDPPKSRFELRRTPIPAKFMGRKDHAELKDLPYKIFFNPSLSEVLCTTTAEALAMGKFVVIPRHPSNNFFMQFPNCLLYSNYEECVKHLTWALETSNKPTPLSPELAYIFTWKAATERLVKAALVTKREEKRRITTGMDKMDDRIAWFHLESGKKGDALRKLLSAEGCH